MSHSKFTSFPSSSIDSAPDSVKSSGKDELVDSCRVDIRKVLDQLSDISSLKEMSVYKLPSEKATEWATP